MTIKTDANVPVQALPEHVNHYSKHSVYSEPGEYGFLLDALPKDVLSLIEVLAGISAHYKRDGFDADIPLSAEDLAEIDLRGTEQILKAVHSKNDAPLTETREVLQRHIGTCRDTTLLLCSFIRHQGIPARVRYGFIHHKYNPRLPFGEHTYVEYWHQPSQSWKIAEPRLSQRILSKHGLTGFQPDDMGDEHFLTAAKAWRLVRENRKKAALFGGMKFSAEEGVWRIRNIMLYDLTSLFLWEPLMWDVWGYGIHDRAFVEPTCEQQLAVLDELSQWNERDPEQWQSLKDAYFSARHVKPSDKIKSCSPENGDYFVAV